MQLPRETNLTGEQQMVIVKFDNSGTRLWSTYFNANLTCSPSDIALSNNGELYQNLFPSIWIVNCSYAISFNGKLKHLVYYVSYGPAMLSKEKPPRKPYEGVSGRILDFHLDRPR